MSVTVAQFSVPESMAVSQEVSGLFGEQLKGT
jgi:hypothetical protein